MKQVLSREEVAALLQGMAEGEPDPRDGESGPGKEQCQGSPYGDSGKPSGRRRFPAGSRRVTEF